MGTTNGKVPGRVKYTFAFGASLKADVATQIIFRDFSAWDIFKKDFKDS